MDRSRIIHRPDSPDSVLWRIRPARPRQLPRVSQRTVSPSLFRCATRADMPSCAAARSASSFMVSSTLCVGITKALAQPGSQVKLLQLPVLGADPAHGAGGGTHHHGLGLDQAFPEANALEQRAG